MKKSLIIMLFIYALAYLLYYMKNYVLMSVVMTTFSDFDNIHACILCKFCSFSKLSLSKYKIMDVSVIVEESFLVSYIS